ncbi:titin-like isoform X2 [Galleria mellonella]|uniref:Titin-like isoform X2 n=1 Tax=Galleria mellonella TaxID=7137 RepID=A0ABM3M9K7_GALME|nr:titin-like isoform X2 [Galleria mellonella]
MIIIVSGLYDPVLDEYEPIYEQIDREDFDRPSQPTEVFQIQQFLDPINPEYYEKQDLNQINSNFYDDPQNPNNITEFNDPSQILLGTPKPSESRSLTASPFALSTKPYRPFSTEPLGDIPDLEDPIILNPNYRDEFGKHGEDEEVVETKFKLPISEQYDPDWKKKQEKIKKEKEIIDNRLKESTERKTVESNSILTKNVEQISKTTIEEFKSELMTKEEIEFTKKMKQEIDIDKIEMTATNIVNESIEKAMTVAEEIKKEIDVELLDHTIIKQDAEIVETKTVEECELTNEKINTESHKQSVKGITKESTSDTAQLSSESMTAVSAKEPTVVTKEASDEIVKSDKTDIKVAKIVEKFDSNEIVENSINERRLSAKQEIEETIESGSVRRKSMIFDTEVDTKEVLERKDSQRKKSLQEAQKSYRQESETFETSQKTNESKIRDERICSKLLAEQRAYTIGLQTIPNIRGSIHSNYHYNLLLKTFFIHLTDVMVALSRFILSEPVFTNLDESQEKVTTHVTKNEKQVKTESEQKETKKDIRISDKTDIKTIVKADENKRVEASAVKDAKEINVSKLEENKTTKVFAKEVEKKRIEEQKNVTQEKIEDVQQNLVVEEEKGHKRNLSGSKMAQLSEKKSEELTVKMDAVISEFQNKTGIEESEVIERRNRRSRSRSQIEEEVMNESDPLEWLAKKDNVSSSQAVTEIKTSNKSVSSMSHSTTQKKVETHEAKQITTTQSKEKQMYVAIVEAHVFTNKDAIFEEQLAEFSETASVQSADEVNIAIECNEAVSTENVALKHEQLIKEVAKSAVEDTHVSSFAATTEKTKVQVAEEVIKDVQEVVEKKSHHQIATESAIKNIKEIESINIKSEQMSVKEECITKSVAKQLEVNVEASKKEAIEIEEIINDSSSVVINEEVENHIQLAEEEIIAEKKEESLDLEVSAAVKVENVIKPIEPQVESTELKIVKEQVIEVDNPPEIRQESQTKIVQIEQSLDLSKQQMAVSLSKFVDISESSSCEFVHEKAESHKSEVIQESTFVAKSSESSTSKSSSHNLTLRTDLAQQVILDRQSSVQSDENNNIDTPTPSTVPPTPLTDEYVFKLQIPLPKTKGTLIVEHEDPNIVKKEDFHEDPNIVKKKLVPHIETNLESPILYDPPLPTPPEEKVSFPVYTKPGLRGGADGKYYRREEILEIGRKSSLLASAIDETIKSIEEYKEQVGMDTNTDIDVEVKSKIEYNTAKTESFSKEETTVEMQQVSKAEEVKIDYKAETEWSKIDKQVTDNVESIDELSKAAKVDITDVDEKLKSDMIKDENKFLDTNQLIEASDKVTDKDIKESSTITEKVLESKENFAASETNIQNAEKINSHNLESVLNFKDESISETIARVEKIENEETTMLEEKKDPLLGYRPVVFNPEEIVKHKHFEMVEEQKPPEPSRLYMTPTGEILGTVQGIVDGLEEATVDEEVAKELGKPGMTEEKIAELISGESEMLREAHVMGLKRVISSHMHRTIEDDSSVDFKKIKPIVESLHNSEVLKALNEELIKTKEEKKKEERKWTTFLQKPKRPVPKAKFGYYAYVEQEEPVVEEPYKVKIVKQPKPKVAPDYKREDFDTGPLPWEERALNEPSPPPIEPEEPILVPEEVPEFLEAVDPLPESEVPDLEETGIPLPPPKLETEETVQPEIAFEDSKTEDIKEETDTPSEPAVEETQKVTENMESQLANQLITNVQSMVDPNATLEQQLAQMRAQLAALAQLPGVIQQTLELVTRQLSQITVQESVAKQQLIENLISETQTESKEQNEANDHIETIVQEVTDNGVEENTPEQNMIVEEKENVIPEMKQPSLTQEEMEKLRAEEAEMLEEQRRIEKQKKAIIEEMRQEQESRQLKQRPTPRVGKPKPVFGPATPQERPLVLPGGRKWRGPKDAYNEQFFAETLTAQAELIQGKTKGLSYESALLPYDDRINFMKYEKPPVSLDHLQHSDVYKLVHNMDQAPVKRVEMLTPVVAEVDYREKCRSISPCVGRMNKEQHLDIPQQLQP